MIFRVDLQAQYLAYRAEIDAAVARVLAGGRYTLGPEVEHFEREFASYLHAPEVIGVADGTRAIVLALRVLGVRPGAEVITTPFTAIPTIGAIIEAGAVPVLVDIDPDTYLIDLDQVAAAVTPRTQAVVPVHMFGNVVDIPALRERIGSDIFIIEDAAQAHGSRLGASFAGTMGDIGTFSFYPTKNLGGYGDGGAIVCRDPAIAHKLRMLRNHGMRDKDICDTPGTNSRLDELQAAILRVKLAHLDEMNAARARLVTRYLEVPSVQPLPAAENPRRRCDELACLRAALQRRSRRAGQASGEARYPDQRVLRRSAPSATGPGPPRAIARAAFPIPKSSARRPSHSRSIPK